MLASETLALSEEIGNAFSMSMFLDESLNNDPQKTIPIKCFVDNSDLVETIKSTKVVAGKRLRIEIASIKEMLDKGEICSITWLKSDDQIAVSLKEVSHLTT